jgi:hypothetical protein
LQHRDLRKCRLDPATDLVAVDIGQLDVEQNEVGWGRGDLLDGGMPGFGFGDRIAAAGEDVGFEIAAAGIVIDDEDASRPPAAPCLGGLGAGFPAPDRVAAIASISTAADRSDLETILAAWPSRSSSSPPRILEVRMIAGASARSADRSRNW